MPSRSLRPPDRTGRLALLALVGLWSVQALPASPLRAPHRLVNGQTVDLNPLFKWWTNHSGPRPLTGWVHVTGAIVGTNSWGWVVQRTAPSTNGRKKNREEESPAEKAPAKVLLLHPPLQDLADFERLKTQLEDLNRSRAQLAGQETQAKNQAQAVEKEQKNAGRHYSQARALGQEAKQLNQVSDQARNQIKVLDTEIHSLKNKLALYPNPDRYLIDCLALDTNQEAQGIPVYDHGSVFQ